MNELTLSDIERYLAVTDIDLITNSAIENLDWVIYYQREISDARVEKCKLEIGKLEWVLFPRHYGGEHH